MEKGRLTQKQKDLVDAFLICGVWKDAAAQVGYHFGYAYKVKNQKQVKEYMRQRLDEIGRQIDIDGIWDCLKKIALGETVAASREQQVAAKIITERFEHRNGKRAKFD